MSARLCRKSFMEITALNEELDFLKDTLKTLEQGSEEAERINLQIEDLMLEIEEYSRFSA